MDLFNKVELRCDGKLIAIPPDAEGIILLNINSYGGGSTLWHDPEDTDTDGDENTGFLQVMALDLRMHPDRQRSAFGVDVPSLFEDVADGSRGSRDHGEYGHDTTLTAARASEDPSTSAVGTQQYSDTLTAASNTSTHASEALAPASRNTFVAASKGMTQRRKSNRLEESARVAQEKKPCSAT